MLGTWRKGSLNKISLRKTEKTSFLHFRTPQSVSLTRFMLTIKDPGASHLSTQLSSVSDFILLLKVKGGTAISGVTPTPEAPSPYISWPGWHHRPITTSTTADRKGVPLMVRESSSRSNLLGWEGPLLSHSPGWNLGPVKLKGMVVR